MFSGLSARGGTPLGCIAASAIAFASLVPHGCLAQTHVVQPVDIANLKTVGHPRVSPDGSLVAYTVETPTVAGKPRNEHIWITVTDHPGKARPFLYSSGVDTSPAWSPDGHHLLFLSNRANPLATPGSPFRFSVAPGTNRPDLAPELLTKAAAAPTEPKPDQEKLKQPPLPERKDPQPAPPLAPDDAAAPPDGMQLWWIALDGGEAEPLTNLGSNIRSFKWSYDGKHIAFIRTDGLTPPERERARKKDDRELSDHEYHFDRLWIYDVDTRQARLLTREDANIDTVDWSPDGTTIVARVSPTPRLDDYWRVSKVEIFDTRTGAVRQVVEETSGYQEPLYSQDGLRLVYSRFTAKRITDMHLVRTLATAQDVRLEDKVTGTIAEAQWLPHDQLLINAYVGAHTEASIVDAKTLAVTPLTGLPLTALEFDTTRDGKTQVFLSDTPAQPAEVSLRRNRLTQVLTSTNPQVSGWSLGTEREVTWKNPNDGRTIYGVLSLPPGYAPGTRYKAVIHLHGGPEEAFTVGFNATWYNYAALLASQGYVVLQPNYRGSAGQDIAFTEGNYRDLGGGDFADVMAGTDWLIAQGFADPDRMAIAGWSYGGFMTAWAVTHTNRFKAAMAGAALVDFFSSSITTDIAPSYLNSYLGPLAGNEAEYDRHSPVRFVAACHTPVLVLHGGADVRVPTSQGAEFYHALRFLGRDTEMVVYPREPHIFTEQEHQIDSLTRELAWFSRYLSPATPTP